MVRQRKKTEKNNESLTRDTVRSNLMHKKINSIVTLIAPYCWIIFIGDGSFVLSLLLLLLFTNILPSIIGFDLFPTNIRELLIVLLCFFFVCLGLMIFIKKLRIKVWLRVLITAISLFVTTILIVGVALVVNTLIFTESVDTDVYESIPYAVVVKKGGDINTVDEIKGRKIGMLEKIDETNIHAFLQRKTNTQYKTVLARAGVDQLATYLLSGEVDAIIIERGRLEYLNSINEDFRRDTEIIYEFATQSKVYKTNDVVDLSEPFIIYINSVDAYEEVGPKIGKNVVSQLMVVNPRVREVLLVDIPTNYYVEITSMGKMKSELASIGLYGIERNIETVEQLFDINVNYYVEYDNKKLDEVIKQLDGVDISVDQISSRQMNEQQYKTIDVIEELLNSSTFSTNYGNLLQAMAGTFRTDIPNNALMVALLQQITAEHNWRFEVISSVGEETNVAVAKSDKSLVLDTLNPESKSILHVREEIEEMKNRH